MKERTSKAIEIINFAIDNNIGVKEASIKFGFASTYVKNSKIKIIDWYGVGEIGGDEYDEFMDLHDKYIKIRNTGTISKPAQTAKIIEDIKEVISAIKEQTKLAQTGNKAEFEWKSGSNYPVDHIRTLEQLLKATAVDTSIWKVKDFIINKWDVTSTKVGVPQTFQNFQIKARLERAEEIFRFQQAAEVFAEMVRDYSPPLLESRPRNMIGEENNLLEISIFDLHMGKLAWAGETGENYDTKIARERFLGSIETLLRRASAFEFSRILFPVGNDFFNSDTILNTTTAGTPQDEDLRWQKTFRVGTHLLVDAINLLKQIGIPVDVLVIPGNHDFERSYYMGEFLSAWFRDDNQVIINNSASPRKYYAFGQVLLGFTHGNEEKESSLPMIMANDIDSKPLWSKTKFHEWHLGHIHRKKSINYAVVDKKMLIEEDLGVTVRYLSSLTGTEEWHHKKGYVGAVKAADAFVWNDELGLVAHINSNLKIE